MDRDRDPALQEPPIAVANLEVLDQRVREPAAEVRVLGALAAQFVIDGLRASFGA